MSSPHHRRSTAHMAPEVEPADIFCMLRDSDFDKLREALRGEGIERDEFIDTMYNILSEINPNLQVMVASVAASQAATDEIVKSQSFVTFQLRKNMGLDTSVRGLASSARPGGAALDKSASRAFGAGWKNEESPSAADFLNNSISQQSISTPKKEMVLCKSISSIDPMDHLNTLQMSYYNAVVTMFNRIDVNNNGDVSWDEFSHYMVNTLERSAEANSIDGIMPLQTADDSSEASLATGSPNKKAVVGGYGHGRSFATNTTRENQRAGGAEGDSSVGRKSPNAARGTVGREIPTYLKFHHLGKTNLRTNRLVNAKMMYLHAWNRYALLEHVHDDYQTFIGRGAEGGEGSGNAEGKSGGYSVGSGGGGGLGTHMGPNPIHGARDDVPHLSERSRITLLKPLSRGVALPSDFEGAGTMSAGGGAAYGKQARQTAAYLRHQSVTPQAEFASEYAIETMAFVNTTLPSSTNAMLIQKRMDEINLQKAKVARQQQQHFGGENGNKMGDDDDADEHGNHNNTTTVTVPSRNTAYGGRFLCCTTRDGKLLYLNASDDPMREERGLLAPMQIIGVQYLDYEGLHPPAFVSTSIHNDTVNMNETNNNNTSNSNVSAPRMKYSSDQEQERDYLAVGGEYSSASYVSPTNKSLVYGKRRKLGRCTSLKWDSDFPSFLFFGGMNGVLSLIDTTDFQSKTVPTVVAEFVAGGSAMPPNVFYPAQQWGGVDGSGGGRHNASAATGALLGSLSGVLGGLSPAAAAEAAKTFDNANAIIEMCVLPERGTKRVITSYASGRMRLFDITTQIDIGDFAGATSGAVGSTASDSRKTLTSPVHCMAYHPQCSLLVTCGVGDIEPIVWSPFAASNRFITRLSNPTDTLRPHHLRVLTHAEAVPHTPYVVTSDMGGLLTVWDLRNMSVSVSQMADGRAAPPGVVIGSGVPTASAALSGGNAAIFGSAVGINHGNPEQASPQEGASEEDKLAYLSTLRCRAFVLEPSRGDIVTYCRVLDSQTNNNNNGGGGLDGADHGVDDSDSSGDIPTDPDDDDDNDKNDRGVGVGAKSQGGKTKKGEEEGDEESKSEEEGTESDSETEFLKSILAKGSGDQQMVTATGGRMGRPPLSVLRKSVADKSRNAKYDRMVAKLKRRGFLGGDEKHHQRSISRINESIRKKEKMRRRREALGVSAAAAAAMGMSGLGSSGASQKKQTAGGHTLHCFRCTIAPLNNPLSTHDEELVDSSGGDGGPMTFFDDSDPRRFVTVSRSALKMWNSSTGELESTTRLQVGAGAHSLSAVAALEAAANATEAKLARNSSVGKNKKEGGAIVNVASAEKKAGAVSAAAKIAAEAASEYVTCFAVEDNQYRFFVGTSIGRVLMYSATSQGVLAECRRHYAQRGQNKNKKRSGSSIDATGESDDSDDERKQHSTNKAKRGSVASPIPSKFRSGLYGHLSPSASSPRKRNGLGEEEEEDHSLTSALAAKRRMSQKRQENEAFYAEELLEGCAVKCISLTASCVLTLGADGVIQISHIEGDSPVFVSVMLATPYGGIPNTITAMSKAIPQKLIALGTSAGTIEFRDMTYMVKVSLDVLRRKGAGTCIDIVSLLSGDRVETSATASLAASKIHAAMMAAKKAAAALADENDSKTSKNDISGGGDNKSVTYGRRASVSGKPFSSGNSSNTKRSLFTRKGSRVSTSLAEGDQDQFSFRKESAASSSVSYDSTPKNPRRAAPTVDSHTHLSNSRPSQYTFPQELPPRAGSASPNGGGMSPKRGVETQQLQFDPSPVGEVQNKDSAAASAATPQRGKAYGGFSVGPGRGKGNWRVGDEDDHDDDDDQLGALLHTPVPEVTTLALHPLRPVCAAGDHNGFVHTVLVADLTTTTNNAAAAAKIAALVGMGANPSSLLTDVESIPTLPPPNTTRVKLPSKSSSEHLPAIATCLVWTPTGLLIVGTDQGSIMIYDFGFNPNETNGNDNNNSGKEQQSATSSKPELDDGSTASPKNQRAMTRNPRRTSFADCQSADNSARPHSSAASKKRSGSTIRYSFYSEPRLLCMFDCGLSAGGERTRLPIKGLMLVDELSRSLQRYQENENDHTNNAANKQIDMVNDGSNTDSVDGPRGNGTRGGADESLRSAGEERNSMSLSHSVSISASSILDRRSSTKRVSALESLARETRQAERERTRRTPFAAKKEDADEDDDDAPNPSALSFVEPASPKANGAPAVSSPMSRSRRASPLKVNTPSGTNGNSVVVGTAHVEQTFSNKKDVKKKKSTALLGVDPLMGTMMLVVAQGNHVSLWSEDLTCVNDKMVKSNKTQPSTKGSSPLQLGQSHAEEKRVPFSLLSHAERTKLTANFCHPATENYLRDTKKYDMKEVPVANNNPSDQRSSIMRSHSQFKVPLDGHATINHHQQTLQNTMNERGGVISPRLLSRLENPPPPLSFKLEGFLLQGRGTRYDSVIESFEYTAKHANEREEDDDDDDDSSVVGDEGIGGKGSQSEELTQED